MERIWVPMGRPWGAHGNPWEAHGAHAALMRRPQEPMDTHGGTHGGPWGPVGGREGGNYINKLPINRPSGRYVII